MLLYAIHAQQPRAAHTHSDIPSPLLYLHPFFPPVFASVALSLIFPPSFADPLSPPVVLCFTFIASPYPTPFHSSQTVADALAYTRGKETGREKRNKRASVKRPFGCSSSKHKAVGLVLLGAKSLSVLLSAKKARDGLDQAVCSLALRTFSCCAQVRLDFWQSGVKACAVRG